MRAQLGSSFSIRLIPFLLSTLTLFIASSGYSQSDNFPPVTDEMLQDPADGDWLMWRRTLDSWGYSPLDEINQDNVSELRMVWTRDLATGTGEITPLAYNGMLFVPQANDVMPETIETWLSMKTKS